MHDPLRGGGSTPEPVLADGEEATLKACGVGAVMLPGIAGRRPGQTMHSERGNRPRPPSLPGLQPGGGQARCRLMAAGGAEAS